MLFTVIELSSQLYLLKDRADCFATLLIGEQQALVFDTGCGIDELHKTIRTITDKPLLVIASHGHFDHIGGAGEFEQVYLASEDRCIPDSYDEDTIHKWLRDLGGQQDTKPSFNHWGSIHDLDFDHFDLGNMICHIIRLPGHSRGSVGVYIPSLRLVLGGDALTPVMCLFFQNHGTLQNQLETLQFADQLDFEYFLTSHSDKLFAKSIINRMIDCVLHSSGKTFFDYCYSKPPYSRGWFYLDSIEDEPIGLIVEDKDNP